MDNLTRDLQRRTAHRLVGVSAIAVTVVVFGVLGVVVAYGAAGWTVGGWRAPLFKIGSGGIDFFPGWRAWQVQLLLISLGMVALGGVLGAAGARRMKRLLAESRRAHGKPAESGL